MCHFAPIPDPEARFRGMSWLTPLVRELQADKAMTEHKLTFFEKGATPNIAVMLDVTDPDKYEKWVEKIRARFGGAENAYETMVLGAGAKVQPVGSDIRQIDFKVTQGAGETRIAAAASVPPVIVGLSEGLAAATYSNYALAMRRFADLTMRPLWRNICGSLAQIIDVPPGSELWYDDRDIAALKDDIVSRAEVQSKQGAAARQMFDAGYLPNSIVEWLNSDDITQLRHSGSSSIQTQEGNGNGAAPQQPQLPEGEERNALPPARRSVMEELEAALEEGAG
jgi:phage portal protein BeeE